jgi:hypothetical protein
MTLLTEDEATKRWCPFVRITGVKFGVPFAHNRLEGGPPLGRCIGASCMAWRGEPPVFVPAEAMTPELLARELRGYCGLAGRPS